MAIWKQQLRGTELKETPGERVWWWYQQAKSSAWPWEKASANRCCQWNNGGTKPPRFALGDKDSSIFRHRGSNFQGQLEFYLRFDLWVSSVLKTAPVTDPTTRNWLKCVSKTRPGCAALCSACLGPICPETAPQCRVRALLATMPSWDCPSVPPHLSALPPLHHSRTRAFPSLWLTSLPPCASYFYITFCSCLT